jgi:hypothetical protein
LSFHESNLTVEIPAASSDRYDDQYYRSGSNVINDGDTASGGIASIADLFGFSGDERSSESDSPTPVEVHSSFPAHNDQAGDSNTSRKSAPEELRKKIPRDYSADSDQTRHHNNQS